MEENKLAIQNELTIENIERFPEEFCFQLNEKEFKSLRCQFVTLNENRRGQHRKYIPYVFTEQGIAMLSALLKSDIAVSVSVNIMKAFIEMRKFLMINGQVFERLTSVEYKLLEHDKKFDEVFNQLQLEENNVEVVILTSDKSNIENLDIKKFNKEYPILKVAKTNKFHDRFIVIDNREMYHLGASIKDLGKKCFAINRIEDKEIIEKIISL